MARMDMRWRVGALARGVLCTWLLVGLVTACSDGGGGSTSLRDGGIDAGPPPDDDDDAAPYDDDDGAPSGDDADITDDAAVDDDADEPEPPHEDLDALEFNPQFEADYNNLTPQPWVEVVTETEAQTVVVMPDKLVFPLADNPAVLLWQAGRVIVSAPSAGTGMNPLGFARRVVSVSTVGSTIEVITQTVGLEDIVTGDVQQTFDYDNLKNVDMTKLDLAWAAENLYLDVDVLSPEIEDPQPDDMSLPELDEDDEVVPPEGDPLFGSIVRAFKRAASTVTRAVGGAAGAVWRAAGAVWRFITPSSFTASASISSRIETNTELELFKAKFTKSFNERGKTPVDLTISGEGSLKANVLFRPGAQLGIRIPVPGHDTKFATWLNVDSQFRSKIELGLQLEAEVTSAAGKTGDELKDKLRERSDALADVFTQSREKFLGDPDLKPAGGWKKTVFISNPAMQIVFAGPVPVVFTQTFQLDVECGFSLKASLDAELMFERNTNIKFSTRYEGGKVTGTAPSVETRKNRSVNITGGGVAAVSCGLIPRLNVFVYDTAGLFAGVRGSLIAQAKYQEKCVEDPLASKMRSEVGVGLYGNVGVQVGGRVQAPGSSYGGKAGQKLGTDIGPFELWQTQFPIYSKTWKFDAGLGYCTPTCRNTEVDGAETDLNCGGGSCNGCGDAQMCEKNSDCARGYCSAETCSLTNHCGDGVVDGDETAIDCGGATCGKCRNGVSCLSGVDCTSGFCAVRVGSGSATGYCVQNHCADLTMSADEAGLDCGGATCAKCAVGTRSSTDADCASGLRDGEFCVSASCYDRLVSSDESGLDCGGTSTCRRCNRGEGCAANGDCATNAPVCDPATHLCSPTMCTDTVKNLDETDTDCGGSCTMKCGLGKGCVGSIDCATEAPVCNATTHQCEERGCDAGLYLVDQTCTAVGLGYYSPAGDRQRYACTNKPANSDYTSATAASATCPWTCSSGYLLNGGTCQQNATVQYLRCNADEVAVGINGRGGAWLDALGMQCAAFNGSQIVGSVRAAPSLGGGGGAAFSLTCNTGEVLTQVTGINGWTNTPPNASFCSTANLSRVTAFCKSLSTGVTRTLGVAGGNNGQCQTAAPNSSFSYDCPTGQYIQGVIVDSANTSAYVGKMFGTACR